MVAVIVACEYMGGIHGPGVVSNTDDVIVMSVVRGMRCLCGVCVKCVCAFGSGGMGGESIGIEFYQSCRNRGVCLCLGCDSVGGGCLGSGSGRVVLCLCVLCLDYLCR